MAQPWTSIPHCDGWFWVWAEHAAAPMVVHVLDGLVQGYPTQVSPLRITGVMWRRIPEPRKRPGALVTLEDDDE